MTYNAHNEGLLQEVKTCLRITSPDFDDAEIYPLIQACILDMKGVGVEVDLNNSLHKQAIKHYCKANFGYNPNRSEWQDAYTGLRDALSLRDKNGGDNE